MLHCWVVVNVKWANWRYSATRPASVREGKREGERVHEEGDRDGAGVPLGATFT